MKKIGVVGLSSAYAIAADLVGFHDLEPWNKAIPQWYTEFTADDDFDVCTIATQAT